MLKDTVRISPKLHSFFTKEARKFSSYYPHVYLLGENKNHIAIEGIRLKTLTAKKAGKYHLMSCCSMPALLPETIIQGMLSIYKIDLIPTGVAFVSKSGLYWQSYHLFILDSFKMPRRSNRCYVVSYARHGIYAQNFRKKLQYAIVEYRRTHAK